MYEWDFSVILDNYHLLLYGLLNTLKITSISVCFGLIIGLLLALLRMSNNRLLSFPVGILIEFLRTTPSLAQLFWAFYALPLLIDIKMTPFLAAIVTFTMQSSAFFAEVFRGGVNSIERTQWEGAQAIGMNFRQSMSRIILPQAVKNMIQPFFDRIIELMKITAIVAAVAYSDLLYQANDLAMKTFRPLEVFTTVALIYFVCIFLMSLLTRAIERRVAVTGDTTIR